MIGFILATLAAVWNDPIFGAVAILGPDADTSLFAVDPDNNLGASTNLVSGTNGNNQRSRALIHFDLSSIPTNAVIQSVSLNLNVVIVPSGGGVASSFDLQRLLVDWEEGTGTGIAGSPAQPGETTWNDRLYPTTPWSVPGAAAPADFSATASASTLVSNVGSYTFSSTLKMVSDVQQWLADPSTNFGWIVISESEGTTFTTRRFGSREDPVDAPVLTVNYTPAAVAPFIQSIGMVDGGIDLRFVATAGQSYAAEYRDAPGSGSWLTLSNIPPQAASTNITIVDPYPTNSQRFYRVSTHL